MKYFCVKCKKRHEITDIGIDLHEVCLDQLKTGVNKLFTDLYNQTKNPTLIAVQPQLLSFLNDKDRCGKIFRFKGSDIEGLLENPSSERLLLSGRFTLKFGWLIGNYENNLTPNSSDAQNLAACSEVLESGSSYPIFQQNLKFYFTDVKGQRLFSHVTKEDGDPFTSTYKIADKDSLDEIGKPTRMRDIQLQRGYLRCCPHCGSELSPAVGRAEEIVVGLFGSPRAGKTSCLAAVTSALYREKYKGLSMKSFANDLDWIDLRQEVEKYDKGCKVTKTPKEMTEVPAYSFLIEVGSGQRVLTMVDMPGEFWSSGDSGISQEFYQKYIDLFNVIDCVWFFVSKLATLEYSLGKEGSRTDKQKRLMQDFSEEDDRAVTVPGMLDMNLTAITQKMAAEDQKLPPFACIVTKPEADADDYKNMVLYEMFPDKGHSVKDENEREHSEVLTTTRVRNSGGFQCTLKEKPFFHKSQKVKTYLEEQQQTRLVRTIEKNCARRFYISMAAYGHPAGDVESSSTPPTPYHEMYPLLWTLAITGALPIEHQYVGTHYNWLGAAVSTRKETDIVTFDARNIRSFKNEDDAIRDSASNLFMRESTYAPTQYKY